MIKLLSIDADTDVMCIHNQGGSPRPGVDFAKYASFQSSLMTRYYLHAIYHLIFSVSPEALTREGGCFCDL